MNGRFSENVAELDGVPALESANRINKFRLIYLKKEEFDRIISQKDSEIKTEKELNSQKEILNINLAKENQKLNQEINELRKFKNLYGDLEIKFNSLNTLMQKNQDDFNKKFNEQKEYYENLIKEKENLIKELLKNLIQFKNK